MREAIGGTWLFGLVITFIVFFASFLAISINYSKAFNVKNNIVDLISKYEGNNCNARKKMGEYLSKVGYLVTGKCEDGATGYDLNGTKVDNGKAYFCIKKSDTLGSTSIKKDYYTASIFFRIDLPIVGDLTKLTIKGDTEAIYFAKDDLTC